MKIVKVFRGEILMDNGKGYYGLDYEFTDAIAEMLEKSINCEQALNALETTIEIIKEQPTGSDDWILGRLESIKSILKGDNNE